MKYALIGCGRIAPNHLEAAVNNNLEVVGICDIIPEHMDILIEKVGMKDRNFKQYTDYHEIMRFFLLCIICYLIVKIFECFNRISMLVSIPL